MVSPGVALGTKELDCPRVMAEQNTARAASAPAVPLLVSPWLCAQGRVPLGG